MSLPTDLLEQAEWLAKREPKRPKQASLRRAVSAAYYAVFHLLASGAVTAWLRGQRAKPFRPVLMRAFRHTHMEKAAKSFRSSNPVNVLRTALGLTQITAALSSVASKFTELQQARHEADYDLARSLSRLEAQDLINLAKNAFVDWRTVKGSTEAMAFQIALLTHERIRGR